MIIGTSRLVGDALNTAYSVLVVIRDKGYDRERFGASSANLDDVNRALTAVTLAEKALKAEKETP